MRSSLLKATLVAGTALNLVAWAAQAQTATGVAPPPTAPDEVVVTGSRVITNGNNAPTPLTVVTPEQVMASAPTTLYENLADLPVFSGSRGGSDGPVINSAAGQGAVSSLNLRNMGAQRTLVLFDGNRLPPTTPDGLVDVSALPQLLIQRVDVVTGGASAVYGSDAVTGVVNYITDTKFNGLKLNVQGGISGHNDDGSYQVAIAAGHELFGGRGHIEASFQRNSNDGLLDYQRSWTAPHWTVQGNGTTIPWHLVGGAANDTASYGGVIACASGSLVQSACPASPLVGQTFNQNGVLSTYNPGLQGAANGLASSALQIGGDGVQFNDVSLVSQSITDQFYARFDYDLTDTIHAYIAGSDSQKFIGGASGNQRSFPPGWTISACDPYLSSQIQAQLGCSAAASPTAASQPTFDLEKQFLPATSYGLAQNNTAKLNNYFVVAAINGRFWDNYRWDANYTHSQSDVSVDASNQNREKIYASLDAVTNPANGQIVCNVTLTNPGLYPGCVPFNPFGPTAQTQAALNYMFDTVNNAALDTMDSLSGSLNGSPFKLWAGPVDMAVSGEIRKLTMSLTTTSNPTIFLNCTGLRFNCSPTVPIYPNGWLPISGVTQTVKEAAYEASVPLIKNVPFMEDVNFDGAVRYTEYDNNPGNSGYIARTFDALTWKAGLTWKVTDQFSLRWAQSRDIRAPTLYELYQPQTVGNKTFEFDYLLNPGGQQVLAAPVSGGNPQLVPEQGDTTTVGFVWRPVPQASLSVDYYSINMTNALFTLSGASQPNQAACYASGGTSTLCQLVSRPFPISNTTAGNALTAVYSEAINIAQQDTSGLDVEANYKTSVLDKPLMLRGLLTYQPHIYYHVPNLPVQDTAGVAYPQFLATLLPAPVIRATVYLTYKPIDQWTVDVSERYRSGLRWTSDPTQSEVGGVAQVAYTNLTITHDMKVHGADMSLFLNIQNLFDTNPPAAGQLANNFPGQYPADYVVGDDVVGRYFTLGLHLRY